MIKKQKKVLIRIIVAAILLVILHFVPLEGRIFRKKQVLLT